MSILLLVVTALAAAPTDRVCSIVALPVFRDSAATYLVGVPRDDTVRAAPDAPAAARRSRAAAPGPATHGQLLRVDQLRGPDSARLEHAFARRGVRDALVVPWSYGPACEPIPWFATARWAPVGAPAAFRLHLRPAAEWVGGLPVFDAYLADLQPYPYGPLAPRPLGAAALTPLEFIALFAALPTQADARERPENARARLEAWERAHPELATRYPAAAVLQHARAILAVSPPR